VAAIVLPLLQTVLSGYFKLDGFRVRGLLSTRTQNHKWETHDWHVQGARPGPGRRLWEEGVVSANETTYTHQQNGQTYVEFGGVAFETLRQCLPDRHAESSLDQVFDGDMASLRLRTSFSRQ
jgi:hypothetical protein